MKKIVILAVLFVVLIFVILVAVAKPDSALYGIKSFFIDTDMNGEVEETVLGGHVTDIVNELSTVSADDNLTAEEAINSKGRIVNALIGINNEINTASESENISKETQQDLKNSLYRLNDAYADQRAAILAIDAAMGVDSGSSSQSILTLMAQTQLILKKFVVDVTGTGIILREASDDAAIDAAANIEVDDATGAIIFQAAGDKGGDQPVE